MVKINEEIGMVIREKWDREIQKSYKLIKEGKSCTTIF